jgi:heterodisulfide reductase subunit A
MAKLDKTFPTLDCSACILTPKMSEIKSHPNITLWTYSEVIAVDGFVGNFKVKVKRKPRYIIEDLCVGCLECINACVFKKGKFKDEFNEGLTKRKPIYIPFPQATPLVATIDKNSCLHFKSGKCKQECAAACERNAIDFNQTEEIKEIDIGAIILATGFKTFDATRINRYGYGKYANIYTSLEVERLVNAAGPTGGEVILSNNQKPKSVGIVHCVGSRDNNTNKYCSKVCCMYSLKLAHLIKERTNAEIFNFYIDMRTPGKGYEEFYDKLLEENVHFIRGRVAEITDWAMSPEEEGKLVIRTEDTLIGVVRRIPVDMIVLSVGLEPQADKEEVRRLFNISCSKEGWFLERHPKLAPVSTFTEGVFLAGACQGPKDIPDSVAQAGAAAAEALALVDKGYVEIEPISVFINEDLCSGCKTCISMCPFGAISFEPLKNKANINGALCKGCGTCVATCPSGALQQNLFTDNQIFKEIEGIISYV